MGCRRDFNKYTSNSTTTHKLNSLMAYGRMSKGGPKDKELNIPESGNRIPDVLDEIRCRNRNYLLPATPTEPAPRCGPCHVHLEPGSPPDTVTKPVQLTVPNSEVTMGRAAAAQSYAAVVWQHESGFDKKFLPTPARKEAL